MSEGQDKGKEEEEDYVPEGYVDYCPTPMAQEVLGEEEAAKSASNYARDSTTRHYPAAQPQLPSSRQQRVKLHDEQLMMLAVGVGTGLIFGVLAGWFFFSPVK